MLTSPGDINCTPKNLSKMEEGTHEEEPWLIAADMNCHHPYWCRGAHQSGNGEEVFRWYDDRGFTINNDPSGPTRT